VDLELQKYYHNNYWIWVLCRWFRVM